MGELTGDAHPLSLKDWGPTFNTHRDGLVVLFRLSKTEMVVVRHLSPERIYPSKIDTFFMIHSQKAFPNCKY